MEQKRNVTGAATTVMIALVVSRVTGLIRQMLIPSIIGSNAIGDAYEYSFKITDIMFYLLVGGSIASALIPVLTGYIVKGKEKEGWKAVSTFMNTLVIIAFGLVVLGIIFADRLVPLVVKEGFSAEQKGLVIDLTRILLPSVGLMLMTGILNGVLNSYHRFTAAAYGPSVYNLLCCLSIIFLYRISIQAVAIGVLCSSFAYFLLQLSFALKNMKHYKPVFDFRHEGSRKIFKLAIPSMFSSSIAQINVFITSTFTTLYSAGSLVALTTADRIWQMPYGVFAQGMGIAMLPTISESYAAGEETEYSRVFMKGLRNVLLLVIPSCAGLILLRRPLVALFKFTENFDIASMETAETCLLYYTIALLAHSIVAIFIRGFYALNDTKTPLYTGIFTIFVNIGCAYLFRNYSNLEVGGMALAYSIAGVLNALLLMILLSKKVTSLNLNGIAGFIFKTIISTIALSVVIFIMLKIFTPSGFTPDYSSMSAFSVIISKIKEILFLLIYVTAGAFTYFSLMILLNDEDSKRLFNMVVSKIKRILRIFGNIKSLDNNASK